jgi:hypothetical protein
MGGKEKWMIKLDRTCEQKAIEGQDKCWNKK